MRWVKLKFDHEIVGKIGSMALIRRDEHDIDYNVFSRLGMDLSPDFIWVSSGAVEIGRLDYMKRNNGKQLEGIDDFIKSDYAAQGQHILMENYRRFIKPQYSVRQILVEHQHFNNPEKREFIRQLLLRSVKQNAISIVNYNDSVSSEEIRKMELYGLKQNNTDVVECIDNDETAAQIAVLVRARLLILLTSAPGLLKDPNDPSTLIETVEGKDVYELVEKIGELEKYCNGSSRKGSQGMKAKLKFLEEPIKYGTTVIIGHSKYRLKDLIEGNVERTIFRVR